jgi:hypothetical protein
MVTKILWLISGLIGAKILNEVAYYLTNSGPGNIVLESFLSAAPGTLFLVFCAAKGTLLFGALKKVPLKTLGRIYKALIILIVLLFITDVTYYFANSTNKKYNLSSEAVANKTVIAHNSDPCANQVGDGYFYRFKININNNTVLKEIHYSDSSGDHVTVEAYQNCNIADAKNWICNSPIKKYMVEGKFYIDWSDGTKELCVK